MPEEVSRVSLNEESAFQLANVTKTAPQFSAITPRWLVRFLDWKPLEAGIFRLNRVDESKPIDSTCNHEDDSTLVSTFVQYQQEPREYRLSSINAVLNVHTRVSDLLSSPFDQVREQLRLLIESVKEKQESELLNNADYGLLHNVEDAQKIKTRKGPPTPDDLDELLPGRSTPPPGALGVHCLLLTLVGDQDGLADLVDATALDIAGLRDRGVPGIPAHGQPGVGLGLGRVSGDRVFAHGLTAGDAGDLVDALGWGQVAHAHGLAVGLRNLCALAR